MKRKTIYLIGKQELSTLSTKILLARLKRLLKCDDSVELSDQENGFLVNPNQIQFKNTAQWISAYENVKAELAKCEQLPKGKELEVKSSSANFRKPKMMQLLPNKKSR